MVTAAPRVLFHFAPTDVLRARLEPRLDGLDVRWCAEHDEERFAALLPETDALWHVLRPITAADLARAPRLGLIQKLGSGVNTIDLDRARAAGIAVANMPGANAPAVAEAALTLMLAALRRVVPLDAATRRGAGWPIDTTLPERVGEIGGRTVGLVGHGAIARRLEAPLVALGAAVVWHSPSGSAADPGWRPLDALLAESDIVSLHLPLTASTERLIDARRLALMRPGAVLVNTSRGGVVDEPALVEALRTRLGAAGLDVFAAEPIDPANPLLGLDNVVALPHVAWLTAETMDRCVDIAADNTRRLASGEPLRNLVP
ncbi:NAD(P)-dependent oxidoreductase [Actinomadura xylanilytica]|uniref:NAD(P)-dependent oxidoreductase n=1 Tax=Actinomadura xylanilytica TaxID=887459 RepID=UPI00255B2717|nr:NAD(P)-dependent oxidoreductase [Actinomadura xylanilytica]MDL4770838.1 NAD(P)-dependent oxidoreductase [Actinomadura xylanilytica]